ncbi:MAG: hypothetical protein JSR46_04475, partial [Verrucomicrobia bacterium]|nr:hypothetical protein [Verrucomicrobiota bacterium]
MRLIWTCENVDLVRAFCQYLTTKSITFSVEEEVDTNWGSDHYGNKKFSLWIADEDQVDKAMEYLSTFLESPSSPEFALQSLRRPLQVLTEQSPATRYLEDKLHHNLQTKEPKLTTFSASSITTYILIMCSVVFFLEFWNSQGREKIPSELQPSILTYSPVTKALLFDYPHSYELLDKIIASYGYEALIKPKEPAARFLYTEFRKTPIWHGYYPYIDAWTKNHFTNQIVPTIPLS